MINAACDSELSDEILKFLSGGGTLAEIYDLSPSMIETVYQVGYRYYSVGSYSDAESIFRFLCTFDHFSARNFLALGSCLQMQSQFQVALDAYSFAGVLDCNDPRPPYHAAQCHLRLGARQEAASGFYAASQLKGKQSKHDRLCAEAAVRYKQLSSVLNKRDDDGNHK